MMEATRVLTSEIRGSALLAAHASELRFGDTANGSFIGMFRWLLRVDARRRHLGSRGRTRDTTMMHEPFAMEKLARKTLNSSENAHDIAENSHDGTMGFVGWAR
jgi:hypothetical protein